jgi:hypothetical protein
MPPDQAPINVNVRYGCGCGTFLVVVFAVGALQIGSDWLKEHQAAGLIGGALLLLAVAIAGTMFNRQAAASPSRRAGVACPRCGHTIPAGTLFCGECGEELHEPA